MRERESKEESPSAFLFPLAPAQEGEAPTCLQWQRVHAHMVTWLRTTCCSASPPAAQQSLTQPLSPVVACQDTLLAGDLCFGLCLSLLTVQQTLWRAAPAGNSSWGGEGVAGSGGKHTVLAGSPQLRSSQTAVSKTGACGRGTTAAPLPIASTSPLPGPQPA